MGCEKVLINCLFCCQKVLNHSQNPTAIKQLPTHIAASQIAQQLQLEVNDYEIKHLPKNESFIAIVNALPDHLEILVLHRLLADFEGEIKITSLAKALVKDLEDQFSQSKDRTTAHVIVNDLLTQKWKTPKKYHQSKRFTQIIREAKLGIVPIHLRLKPSVQEEINTPLVSLRIGRLIKVKEQEKFEKGRDFRQFIRSKIIALRSSLEMKQLYLNPLDPSSPKAEIVPPIAAKLLEQDIANIKPKGLLTTRGDYEVLIANVNDIPNVLQEIGRLREITFRAVGEGTGNSRDLDEYDLYYKQLIIWDNKNKRIVGGYRIGEGDYIFEKFGIEGFYIHSLFKIKKGFFPILQKSIELGRSYLVPEYQKERLPLFLLWKGILYFLLQNPQYQYIYGPVSISKYYSNISKSLIVAFVKKFYFNKQLAKYLKPRKPFKVKTKEIDLKALMRNFNGELQNLDNFVEDIEPEHFKIPVLFKQYVKQNARFISFNVDPNFSDVLDGFMILAIKDIPASTLEALKQEKV
ncbi:MAG: GNAT family N-acyltransferase [Chitinophagales bacterium]